jgi:superfamily I DNA/RNA helicase
MCRQLDACVESPAAAQITVSTVHKAKGLEWPRVLTSSDFNQFVGLEKGNPVIDMEEAYSMYVGLTRAREKLILSPACVEAISASAATKAGRAGKRDSRGAENTVELRRARFHRRSPKEYELTAHRQAALIHRTLDAIQVVKWSSVPVN